MTDRRLELWRHGRTEWNATSRFQGQRDVPLDEMGHAQALRAAPLLAELEPHMIVASDLGRAGATASALAELVSHDVRVDPALRETYSGQWEGMRRSEIEAEFAASWDAWADGDDTVRPGGDGELRTEVADRMVVAIERHLVDVPDGGTLVVVTHGGAARVAIGKLMGLPSELWGSLGVLTNCAWSVLVERPQPGLWRLIEYNAGSLPEPALADDR